MRANIARLAKNLARATLLAGVVLGSPSCSLLTPSQVASPPVEPGRTVLRLPVDQRHTDDDIGQTVTALKKVWSHFRWSA